MQRLISWPSHLGVIMTVSVAMSIINGCSDVSVESERSVEIENKIANGAISKMTKIDLEELLGAPNTEGYFSEWDNAFWLGREESGYTGIDSQWLVVNYGPEGMVIEYRIVTD